MGIKEAIKSRLIDWQDRRGLLRTFPELKDNKHELDLLVFRLSRMKLRREPQKPFLEIPRWNWWESVSSFSEEMLGPLYLAYVFWPSKAISYEDSNKAKGLYNFYDLESQMLHGQVQSRLELSFMSRGIKVEGLPAVIKEAMKRFSVEIHDVPKIETKKQLSDAVSCWVALLNEHTWKDVIPGQPRIGVLGEQFDPALMPRKIIITDLVKNREIKFDRLFARYYIPDVYKTEKRTKALFDFLAKTGKIAEISDYKHKEKVTDVLLEGVTNRVKQEGSANVLDVGCGDGFVGDVIEKKGLRGNIFLNGMDLSPEMLDKLQGKGTYGNIRQLGIASASPGKIKKAFRGENFTDVVMAFVDIYMADYERMKAYKTIYELLPEGGTLSFDVHHPDAGWQHFYGKYLKAAGFSRVINLYEQEVPAQDGNRKVGFVFAKK